MPKQKRRPLGDGAVLLGGERPDPTETLSFLQPEKACQPSSAAKRHAELRSRLAQAASYGQEVCAEAISPCSRDLAWWLCRLGNRFAHDAQAPLAQIEREVLRAVNLWRACMEIEFLESGHWPAEVDAHAF